MQDQICIIIPSKGILLCEFMLFQALGRIAIISALLSGMASFLYMKLKLKTARPFVKALLVWLAALIIGTTAIWIKFVGPVKM